MQMFIQEDAWNNTHVYKCVIFQIEDNVCYRSLGHSYFLEDGSEMYNTFDGNIAIGTMEASLIPTDRWASVKIY